MDRPDETASVEQVGVWRGKYGDPVPPAGPLPGVRSGRAVAYEMVLPDRFVPWPGRSRLERVYVLLDLGVSMSLPCWRRLITESGEVVMGIDHDQQSPNTWYIDLIHVSEDNGRLTFRDLWIDVMVPTDGRHYRMLDLDEFADAVEERKLPLRVALDGLRRWQQFLDEFLHHERDPRGEWTDFPPALLDELAALPGPFASGH